MSFLLDTDICSAFIRGKLTSRFNQYEGRLAISTVTLSELYTWAYSKENPEFLTRKIMEFLTLISLISFDEKTAFILGRIRGEQQRRGISFSTADLQIAATALAHDLTLVTHNTKDFINVPDLRLADWLE